MRLRSPQHASWVTVNLHLAETEDNREVGPLSGSLLFVGGREIPHSDLQLTLEMKSWIQWTEENCRRETSVEEVVEDPFRWQMSSSSLVVTRG